MTTVRDISGKFYYLERGGRAIEVRGNNNFSVTEIRPEGLFAAIFPLRGCEHPTVWAWESAARMVASLEEPESWIPVLDSESAAE